jgi:DNA adenine methylase
MIECRYTTKQNKENTRMTESLSPLFKWTGGKRREIVHFAPYYPEFIKNSEEYTYIEPFAGAAATYWSLNNINGTNIINEFDYELINFYEQVKKQDKKFLKFIHDATILFQDKTSTGHDKQESMYYEWRNKDRNNGLKKMSNVERAARFFIVNQLAFSGMRRFNASGEFNVPYGHYKNLNDAALTSKEHVKLLKNTQLMTGDYSIPVKANDTPNTFIFIDPPYTRVMKTYSADNEFGDNEQRILAQTLKDLKNASWMVIIDKSPLTLELYKDYIKHTYGLNYGVNIKNRFSTEVEHIIATNY